MNLHQLTTFCTVLNEKSMTAAAQKLHLTQPAVSQQIRNLEDELGVELLVRGVRHILPTPAGQVLMDYARRIIFMVQQAELAVQTVNAEVKGPLRLGTLNSIGLHLISPIFDIFLKNNKDVTLKLKYGNGLEILKGLEEGELDMAVLPDVKREYGASATAYEAHLVSRYDMWLVASGADANVTKEAIPLKDFGDRPIVWLTQDYPGFEALLLKELKRAGLATKPVFESSNVGTLKRVIESGLGWGFLPSHSVRKQVKTGRMRRIEVTDFTYTIELYCYLPKNLQSVKTLELFLKALQQQVFEN